MSKMSPKHMAGCAVIVAVALIAVLAGSGAGVFAFALIACAAMMGAMMWMMMRGMGGSGDSRK